jgi:hypothetical protein
MDEDDREKETIATLRAEALGLFNVNQAGRQSAERVLALIIAASAVIIGAAINSDDDDVVMILPPLVLLLLSYMFQQYIEVTVTGAARKRLEDLLARRLGAHALIYEYAVAPIRKESSLKGSFRLLQSLVGVVIAAILVVGAWIALDDQRWYVTVAYVVATFASALSAGWSFVQMRSAGDVASESLAKLLR